MNYIYTVLVISLSVGLSFLGYRIYIHSQKETKKYIENNEFPKKRGASKSNLLFFYTNWCNHCTNSKPIWENVKKDNEFQKFNLNFVDVNGEDEKNKELLKHYKIEEYPTIILDHDNKKFIFDANLTTETLLKFLSSVYR